MNHVLNRRHLLQLATVASLPAGGVIGAEKSARAQTAPNAAQALEILMQSLIHI